MKYLIIGNSAAGIGAVEGIRKYDKSGKITLVADEPHHTYSRPLISYLLAGKVSRGQMNFRPTDFYQKYRVNTRLGIKVTGVDEINKKIVLQNDEEIQFNRLLIATGGRPFIPPIKGSQLEGIHTFLKLTDVLKIKDDLAQSRRVSGNDHIVILGAGLIGLKAAEAFIRLGYKVTVVELAGRVLPKILDRQAAALVQSFLEEKGIEFRLKNSIERFIGADFVRKVSLKSGELIPCRLALIAVGVRPQVSLVEGTEIKVNLGILIDRKMETNVPDIFAAGDVTEGFDLVRRSSGLIPIWPNAYIQGHTAGKNMSGEESLYEEGFARNSISFFDLPMITAGIIDPEGEGYEIIVNENREERVYQKLILRDNTLVGFISLNKIRRSGIFTGLIKEQKNVEKVKTKFLDENFGYLSFNPQWRKEKLYQ